MSFSSENIIVVLLAHIACKDDLADEMEFRLLTDAPVVFLSLLLHVPRAYVEIHVRLSNMRYCS